jgi:glucose-6-phosphate isomerase
MSDLWGHFKAHFYTYNELGLSLDISRMRFNQDFFATMSPKIEAALNNMQELEQGGMANPDENRMVGHYWLRAPKLSPNKNIEKNIIDTLQKVKVFADDIHSGKIRNKENQLFLNVLLIGIGGSVLGPQLVTDALSTGNDKMKLVFIDNTDPDGIYRTLYSIRNELSQTIVLVISKSGATQETHNAMCEVRNMFKKQGLAFESNAVAVTHEQSVLHKQARDEGWLGNFPLWDWVGGRTSIFSAVGLLPASLQGVDIDSFLGGARLMDEQTRNKHIHENPAMMLALMWFATGNGYGEKDMVVIAYKDRLVLFSKYLQQLIMESLGKAEDLNGKIVNQGIVVYGNKGSTDQHAYVQQLRDGPNNFFVTFIEVLKDVTDFSEQAEEKPIEIEQAVTSGDYLNGFLQGTRTALYNNNRDSITITLESLTSKSLGSLIALYERATGFYASFINVNAYNQPGVEAGKKAAMKVIKLQNKVLAYLKSSNKNAPLLVEEIANAIKEPHEKETVYKILEHLVHNNRGIKKSGETSPSLSRYIYSNKE